MSIGARARPRILVVIIAVAALLVALVMPSVTGSSRALAVGASVAVTPTSGPQNSPITVSGDGFPSSTTLQIDFDQTTLGMIPTSTTGTFTGSFKVPIDASIGLHPVYALGQPDRASTDFTVTPSGTPATPGAPGGTPAPPPPTSVQPNVTVGQAFTGLDGKEKTLFYPGDRIWYLVSMTNSGAAAEAVDFTWDGYSTTPAGRSIFHDKNIFSVQPGTFGVYSPGTIPQDAEPGSYENKETVIVGGGVPEVRTSKFTVIRTVTLNPAVWAGWGGGHENGYVTSVSGKWKVPEVSCGLQGSLLSARAAPWVGLAGWPFDDWAWMPQVGTISKCKGLEAVYSTDFQLYRKAAGGFDPPVETSTVKAGDEVVASVTFDGSKFKASIRINGGQPITRSWPGNNGITSIADANGDNSRKLGLCILEDQPGQLLPLPATIGGLAEFDLPLDFTECKVDEVDVGSMDVVTKFPMGGDRVSFTDPGQSGSFSLTWHNW
jgi:hypothetical protein